MPYMGEWNSTKRAPRAYMHIRCDGGGGEKKKKNIIYSRNEENIGIKK